MPYQEVPESNQGPPTPLPEPHAENDCVERRHLAPLRILDLFTRQRSLPELLLDISAYLREVIDFELLIFAMWDHHEDKVRLTSIRGAKESTLSEISVAPSSCEWMWKEHSGLLVSDLAKNKNYLGVIEKTLGPGMSSVCSIPLMAGDQRLGAVVIASAQPSAYLQANLDAVRPLVALIALEIENLINRESLARDKKRLQFLSDIIRILYSRPELELACNQIKDELRRVMSLDYVNIWFPEKQAQVTDHSPLQPGLNECDGIGELDGASLPAVVVGENGRAARCYERCSLEQSGSSLAKRLLEHGIQRACCFPLVTSHGVIGTLHLACKRETRCAASERGFIYQVANYLAMALDNAKAHQEITGLKAKLAEEKLYLEDEIRTELQFEEIVGESSQIKRALVDVRTVAGSDANVLILGETGTGKELIARAIHKLSGRKDNNFIKLNCAAIPTGLLESELFGHEKGAFTGAITQKVGRMELAHGGTLFLDEVGDIPLELQPKLLRVLQDQEFERLGSTRTIKVNVRLVAATNRDLGALVAAREFRSDLYYRLRVFPIHLAPLRERRGDIPLLVRYFVQRLSRRMNKSIDSIPATTMDVLTSWDWPGNIRELENFLERSVILSNGPSLTIPASELRPLTDVSSRRDTSLETAEREHILRILRETSGVISGARGAAARLGLKRTTLQSKMQKLGISRMDYQN